MKVHQVVAFLFAASIAGASPSQADMARKDPALTAKYCRHLVNAKNLEGESRRVELATCNKTFPDYK
jgi:hypothetical protein